MQEVLDFCGKHNITSDVEVISIQQINGAYERILKSDMKYRFSIDMASLRIEKLSPKENHSAKTQPRKKQSGSLRHRSRLHEHELRTRSRHGQK
jgi:hypothetical protein